MLRVPVLQRKGGTLSHTDCRHGGSATIEFPPAWATPMRRVLSSAASSRNTCVTETLLAKRIRQTLCLQCRPTLSMPERMTMRMSKPLFHCQFDFCFRWEQKNKPARPVSPRPTQPLVRRTGQPCWLPFFTGLTSQSGPQPCHRHAGTVVRRRPTVVPP